MTTPSVLTSFLGYFAVLCPIFALYILFKVHIYIRITWLQNGSLASLPGPRLAPSSRLWIVRAQATGRSHEVWIRINNRYGPLSQICLKLVVTDDPEITRWLLVAFLGYERRSAFDLLRTQPATLNIISGRDSRKYGLSNVAKSVSYYPKLP